MKMRNCIVLFTLAGCTALLDDSDMVWLERPEVANECAAWLMDEDIRPLPQIIYTNNRPWHPDFGFVQGYYSPSADTIVVQHLFNQSPILLHELAHVYGATEREAWSVARRGRDCVNFGGL